MRSLLLRLASIAVISLLLAAVPHPAGAAPAATAFGSTVAQYTGATVVTNPDGSHVDTTVGVVAISQLKLAGHAVTNEFYGTITEVTWSAGGALTGYEYTEIPPTQVDGFRSDPLLRETAVSGTVPYLRHVFNLTTETFETTEGVGPISVTWTGVGEIRRFTAAGIWYPGDVGQVTVDTGLVRTPTIAGSVLGTQLPMELTYDAAVYLARHVSVTPK